MIDVDAPVGLRAGRHRAAAPEPNPDLPDGYADPTRPDVFVPIRFRTLYRLDESWELVELCKEMSRSALGLLGSFPAPIRIARNRVIRAAYVDARASALAAGADPAGWPPPSLDLPAEPVAFTIAVRTNASGGYAAAKHDPPPAAGAGESFMLGRLDGRVRLPTTADAGAIAEWRHRLRIGRAAAELADDAAATA